MQNAFKAFMDPKKRYSDEASCTTCQFAEDFSNYWTAVMYFKARNGTYKRVPQRPNSGFEPSVGGTTVYYMQNSLIETGPNPAVTAFQSVSPLLGEIRSTHITITEGFPHVRGKS
jgi:hypothetical protein